MPDAIVEMLAEGILKPDKTVNMMVPENIIIALIVCLSWIVVSIFKR